MTRSVLRLLPLEDRTVPVAGFTAAGAAAGGTPLVAVFRPDGTTLAQFSAFEEGFRGGVRVATAELDNNSSTQEIVAGAGPGGGPAVRLFSVDVASGTVTPRAAFFAFEESFRGGVRVAAGDVGGRADGLDEIIVGAGEGGGPRVRLFAATGGGTGVRPQADFFAFEESFRGGVRVAAGELDGDPSDGDEFTLAAGTGGGPRVRVVRSDGAVLADYFAFRSDFRGGANVSIGADNTITPDALALDPSQRNAALNQAAFTAAGVRASGTTTGTSGTTTGQTGTGTTGTTGGTTGLGGVGNVGTLGQGGVGTVGSAAQGSVGAVGGTTQGGVGSVGSTAQGGSNSLAGLGTTAGATGSSNTGLIGTGTTGLTGTGVTGTTSTGSIGTTTSGLSSGLGASGLGVAGGTGASGVTGTGTTGSGVGVSSGVFGQSGASTQVTGQTGISTQTTGLSGVGTQGTGFGGTSTGLTGSLGATGLGSTGLGTTGFGGTGFGGTGVGTTGTTAGTNGTSTSTAGSGPPSVTAFGSFGDPGQANPTPALRTPAFSTQ